MQHRTSIVLLQGVIRGDCVLHIICTPEGQEQGGQMNDLQFYVLFNSISVKG